MASIWLRSFEIKKEKLGCPLYPGSRENSGYVPDPKCNHIMRLNVSQHSNKDMLLNNANFQQPALFRFSSRSFSCTGSRNMLTSVPRNSCLRPGKMLRSNMDNIPVKQTTLFSLKQFLFKILFRRFLINVLFFSYNNLFEHIKHKVLIIKKLRFKFPAVSTCTIITLL